MQKILKFAGVGIVATIVDYLIYQLCFWTLGQNVTLSAVLSGIVATFVAYLGHSHITWKTRDPGRFGIIKFFIWNFVVVIGVRPVLTWFFGLLTGLYEFAFAISGWLHLPFDYAFISSTGIYVLMTIVTMILNFIFYERIVFSKEKTEGKQVDVQSVRQAGKEK